MADYEVTQEQLLDFYNTAYKLMMEASETVRNAISQEKVISTKLTDTDLVTLTDQAVEKHLFDGLRSVYPDHKFIGEETTSEQGMIGEFTNNPTWIIDPIDGTMNFVHTNPNVSISIGLVVNKRVQIGLIHVPMLNQTYSAIKGQGAKLDGKPIKVSGCKDISKAMMLMEIHAREDGDSEKVQLRNLSKIIPKVQSFRAIGSAAIDLAYVASGASDAFFHFGGIHCWDVVAGALILLEAGGYVCDAKTGGEFNYMDRYILAASSKELADQIVALGLETADRPKDSDEFCPL